MNNSQLASYVKLIPKKRKRKYKVNQVVIDSIIELVPVEVMGQSGFNYAIGRDGNIGLFVEENKIANNPSAITINVVENSEAAYESLILLLSDICKRNNIKKIQWKSNYLIEHSEDILEKVSTIESEPKAELEEKEEEEIQVNIGDSFFIKQGAKFINGDSAPSWLIKSTLIVKSVENNKKVIGFTLENSNSTIGKVNIDQIEKVVKSQKAVDLVGYKAIIVPNTNLHAGAGFTYPVVKFIKNETEVYIETVQNNWGKVSGTNHWVNLFNTKRV